MSFYFKTETTFGFLEGGISINLDLKKIIIMVAVFIVLLLSNYSERIGLKHVNQFYNIKTDFGVKGNGIIDDTTKIQEAINEVPAGSTIIFPKGTYKITKNSAHKVTTGYGESYSAIKIDKPINIILDEAEIVKDGVNEYGVFWIHNTNNVSITGGFLIGNSNFLNETQLTSSIGILVQHSESINLKNIYTRNFTQGVNLYESKNNELENITSEYNKGSGIISFRSSYSDINECLIRNSGDGSISLYGGGHNNTVNLCNVVEDRNQKNNQQGITIESESNSTVGNSVISGFYYGIDIKNGSNNVIVKSNRVFNNQFNIAVRSGDSGVNLKTISNNISIINNNVLDVKKITPNAGIYIGVGKEHVVKNNVINSGSLEIGENVISTNINDKDNKFQ